MTKRSKNLKWDISGDKLIVSEPLYPTHEFQIVDFVPYGYEIWNIGSHMPEGYLPLCRLAAHQRFPGGQEIDVDALKAIRTEHADILMHTSMLGFGNLRKMELYLKRYKSPKEGTATFKKVELLKKVLPLAKTIKWN